MKPNDVRTVFNWKLGTRDVQSTFWNDGREEHALYIYTGEPTSDGFLRLDRDEVRLFDEGVRQLREEFRRSRIAGCPVELKGGV